VLWNKLPHSVHLIDHEISKYRYNNDIYFPKSKNKGLRYFPREIKWISPESIKFFDTVRLFSSIYYIQNGEWDKSIASIKDRPQYRVVDELLNKSYSIEKLTDYDFTVNKFISSMGVSRNKAEELTKKKYSNILELAKKIKKNGYKTQKELGLSSYNKFNTWYDEIRVSVTRNGEYILNGSGNHRLCIAQQLGIKQVPVVVIRMHYKFFHDKT
tara:strand:+ start:2145 stop:2783 length:639 start_codon:yes stop_codon:yes gene_type:complete